MRNNFRPTFHLTAREVCQMMTGVALGNHPLMRSSMQSWSETITASFLLSLMVGDSRYSMTVKPRTIANITHRLAVESGHLNSGSATEWILSTYYVAESVNRWIVCSRYIEPPWKMGGWDLMSDLFNAAFKIIATPPFHQKRVPPRLGRLTKMQP